MDPISIAMLLGSVFGPAIGGAIGNAAGAGDRDKANALRARAASQYDGIGVPDLASLSPELIDEGFLDKYNVDPRYKQVGLNALLKLQSMADSNGLDPEAAAELAAVQSKIASQERGSREAILRQTQAGSGSRIAAQMAASQAAADRASQEGLGVAAMARRNALNALMGSAQLSNQMSDNEAAQMDAARRARMTIKQFNNANTNRYRMDMPFKRADLQLGIAHGRANAYTGQANALDHSADRSADMGATIGQGVGLGLGYGQQAYQRSQQPVQAAPASKPYTPDFSYGVQNQEDESIPYFLRRQQ